jgi:hypothetical protein
MSDTALQVVVLVGFTAFFVLTVIPILKKHRIFAIYYGFLFLYGFSTGFGYVFMPRDISAAYGGQYYGVGAFYPYIEFIFLSMLAIWVGFMFIFWKQDFEQDNIVKNKVGESIYLKFTFAYLVIIYGGLIWLIVLSSYETLAYDYQAPIKGVRGVFLLIKLGGVVGLLLFVKVILADKLRDKAYYLALILWVLLPWIIIMVRQGSRDEIFALTLACMYYSGVRQPLKKSRTISLVVAGVLLTYILLTLQVARRAGQVSFIEFISLLLQPGDLLQDYVFSIDGLILQDFTGPALVLMTSIEFDLIFTLEAIKSLLLNGAVLIGYPTLGYTVSRIVKTNLFYQWEGFGYYILAEGYNLVGWLGIIYNGVMFNAGLYLWTRLSKVGNRKLRLFLEAVVVMQAIDVIRGQSSTFLRATYTLIIPAILLYWVADGKLPTANRIGRTR